MALHVLNVSVDIPDPQPENIPEDLSMNEMESLVEIVLEKLVGMENAVKEYDEAHEHDADGLKHSRTLHFYIVPSVADVSRGIPVETIPQDLCAENVFSKYVNDIIPPPPKA
jgi:hypothetical protein